MKHCGALLSPTVVEKLFLQEPVPRESIRRGSATRLPHIYSRLPRPSSGAEHRHEPNNVAPRRLPVRGERSARRTDGRLQIPANDTPRWAVRSSEPRPRDAYGGAPPRPRANDGGSASVSRSRGAPPRDTHEVERLAPAPIHNGLPWSQSPQPRSLSLAIWTARSLPGPPPVTAALAPAPRAHGTARQSHPFKRAPRKLVRSTGTSSQSPPRPSSKARAASHRQPIRESAPSADPRQAESTPCLIPRHFPHLVLARCDASSTSAAAGRKSRGRTQPDCCSPGQRNSPADPHDSSSTRSTIPRSAGTEHLKPSGAPCIWAGAER